ncbi:MAG: ATP-binding cassette domain-containing protein [Shimia sp.]
MAFILYIVALYQPLFTVVQAAENVQCGTAGLGRVATLLDTEPEVADCADAVPLPRAEGAISLDGIGFSYADGRQVPSDVTLAIAPEETVALIGPTGAGKCTLSQLIARFYDVTEASITLDGMTCVTSRSRTCGATCRWCCKTSFPKPEPSRTTFGSVGPTRATRRPKRRRAPRVPTSSWRA